MPNPPRELPHLYIEGGGDKEPYTAHAGGGPRRQPPARDREAHAARLTAELAASVEAGREALAERPADLAPTVGERVEDQGFYLEFALEGPTASAALQSLEDQRRGIELVAVRTPAVATEGGGEVVATVFVPERSAEHFARRIEEFRVQSTETGRPKNEPLVASITSVRAASPRSLFTDPPEAFPQNADQDLWWEVWIRRGFEAQVDVAAQRLGILVKPHVVRFAERDVKVVLGSVAKLARLMHRTDGVAELRLARDTPTCFVHESNVDQGLWIEDTASRLEPLPDDGDRDVAICLLDTGITREHPLLAPRIDPADVHTVDPAWGGADNAPALHAGHGTGMAGLALFGDLTEVLPGTDPIRVPHRLESVKILPPAGAYEPDAYGAIVLQAISRAEIAAPDRHRIVCMAVTAPDSGRAGRPSAWSAAIDKAAFGALPGSDEFATPRLIVMAAGNIREREVTWAGDYLERNDTSEIESPAQAWNALTVGAYTEKVNVLAPEWSGWGAVAPAGDLCPASRTGLMWEPQWPVKPDVVFEGGNYVHDGGPHIDAADDVQLLTTYHRLSQRLLTTFGDTSAAAALSANMAARIAATRPAAWPETIRALIVHSAEWTDAMRARAQAGTGAAWKRLLLRRYGYGVPSLERALRSARNDLTLVVEDSLQPFRLDGSTIKTYQMSIHRLPWPTEVLAGLGDVEVELRVTLSYFIEPNPGERGWTRRHRYASHGLRFRVKQPLESDAAFQRRLSKAVEAEDDAVPGALTVPDSEGWLLGPSARSSGSIHSDVWRGTAADLARRGAIGVHPVGGWWKERKVLRRYDSPARYSLIASIRVPDLDVDIYTPVRVAIGIGVPTIDIDVNTEI